jgi:wyosine [tRNA(Phe)-imidazoG37] synthetase (radical SAM superfamily)
VDEIKVAEKKKYVYGPVPSRRLGRSLGVDVVPFKVCTLDCIYCQLGKTSEKTTERKEYVLPEEVLAELRQCLAQGLQADFITISGSGEPTLNSRLGEIIDGIKKITDIPVAILTNGTLLYRQDVRTDCAKADVVLPSLDAGDRQAFEEINRPHKHISIENLISGLCVFRNEFTGQIWLEVFLIERLNTDSKQIAKIKNAIKRIRPDKVQLNTAVRPAIYAGIKKVPIERLEAIASSLGRKCEIIADFSPGLHGTDVERKAEDLLSMLKRRPCSINDICAGLGIARNEASKYIAQFQEQGIVDSEEIDGTVFFKAN